MDIEFSWLHYGFVSIGFLVVIGLLCLRWRRGSNPAPDARIVVAAFSTLVFWRAGAYMNPDQVAPDSPLWDLILLATFLLAANEAVWKLHRSARARSEPQSPKNAFKGDAHP